MGPKVICEIVGGGNSSLFLCCLPQFKLGRCALSACVFERSDRIGDCYFRHLLLDSRARTVNSRSYRSAICKVNWTIVEFDRPISIVVEDVWICPLGLTLSQSSIFST